MRRQIIGWSLFTVGAALAATGVAIGKLFLPELQGPTARPLAELEGTGAMVRLPVFGHTLPVGLTLVLVGATVLRRCRPAVVVTVGLAGLGLSGLLRGMPALSAGIPASAYFGAGGLAILAMFVASAWLWSQADHRRGCGLQALGYLCFALAAWSICGAAGLPGHALRPEQALALGTSELAAEMFRAAMAYFVIGWALTAGALAFKRRPDGRTKQQIAR